MGLFSSFVRFASAFVGRTQGAFRSRRAVIFVIFHAEAGAAPVANRA